MKYRLTGIPPEYLDAEWDNVSHFILSALEYAGGKYTLRDIYNAIKSSEFILCAILNEKNNFESVQVLQLVRYPQKKVMIFVLVAGSGTINHMHFMEDFKRIAKRNGAEAIECYARHGWEKILIPYGFKKVHTYYSLPI